MRIFKDLNDNTQAVYSDAEADALPSGWTEITREEFEAIVAARQVPPPSEVPQVVTMRQARLALLDAGLLAQVDVAIEGLPSPQKEAARIEWEYSQEVHRDRPFVQTLGAAMGLSPEHLDALFVQAATL